MKNKEGMHDRTTKRRRFILYYCLIFVEFSEYTKTVEGNIKHADSNFSFFMFCAIM